ncbi:hypothetical protein HQ563_08935 [bacterium]|nr:hypothetical protein [bacterium]
MRLFGRKSSDEAANRVFLAVFGKHPGWDDHIEDLGLETEQLIGIKRLLYIEGISGNVDSGAWDKLPEAQRLGEFNHLFLWRTISDLVVGRMWSSMDGKGRTHYPMVVCAQCSGLPLPGVLQQVLPCLEEVKARCVNAALASAVKFVIENARRELGQLAQQIRPSTDTPGIPGGTLAVLADRPEMGRDYVGLLRILYRIEQGMADSDASGKDTSTRVAPGRLHIRVPPCADSPADTILLWLSFLLGEVDRSNPMILLLPLRESWVDIIVGEPTAKDLFCIRASLEAIPPTTDIPYTLHPGFMEQVNRRIACSRVESRESSPAGSGSPPRRIE